MDGLETTETFGPPPPFPPEGHRDEGPVTMKGIATLLQQQPQQQLGPVTSAVEGLRKNFRRMGSHLTDLNTTLSE
eukprot:444596-Pyramimonas_sp.AAC.1